MLDPMSHMSCRVSPTLPRTRGQVRGKGQEVIWAQAETTPPPGSREVIRAQAETCPPVSRALCFHFLHLIAEHLQTAQAPSTPYGTRICPGASPARPSPLPASYRPSPRPCSMAPCPSWGNQASLPPPAGSQPAAPRPWGPAAQPAIPTPASSPCVLQSHHGETWRQASPHRMTLPPPSLPPADVWVDSRLPLAQWPPLSFCASGGLRMPPEVLTALPSPGAAQASPTAPEGPCTASAQPIAGCRMKTPEAGWLMDNKHFFLTVSEAGSLRPEWRQGLLKASFQVAGYL